MKRILAKLMRNSIFKFILVGGCSTGIDYIMYILLSLKLPITASKGISMIVASIFSYVINKIFTFENKDKTNMRYLIRFYFVFIINLGTNLVVNYLVYQNTGYKSFAFVLATLCGMIINYSGQKFFVFERKLHQFTTF